VRLREDCGLFVRGRPALILRIDEPLLFFAYADAPQLVVR
jgi:hypothetical protein